MVTAFSNIKMDEARFATLLKRQCDIYTLVCVHLLHLLLILVLIPENIQQVEPCPTPTVTTSSSLGPSLPTPMSTPPSLAPQALPESLLGNSFVHTANHDLQDLQQKPAVRTYLGIPHMSTVVIFNRRVDPRPLQTHEIPFLSIKGDSERYISINC